MNSFLLDTHVWIWMLEDSRRLRPRTREILSSDAVELLISTASVWEISVKANAGKLTIPLTRTSQFVEQLNASGVTAIPVALHHAASAGALPPHHGDPFDRMIVAQAQALGVPVITVDPKIARYDVETVMD